MGRKKYDSDAVRRVARIWYGMKQRCFNPNGPSFEHYGGRGISVCERWLASFEHFLADMGLPPTEKHSIDRIDNDGNYEPGNCRSATQYQQSINRRDTVMVEWQGAEMTAHAWADMMGLSRKSVHSMLWGSRYSPSRILEVHAERAAGKDNARLRAERKQALGPRQKRTYRDVWCAVCRARHREFNGETLTCPWEHRHPPRAGAAG